MKLLFDENLSPRLAERVADLFPGSAHVHALGLGSTDDATVWQFARSAGWTLVTRDSDYYDMSLVRGAPPKLVWIRRGNCSTDTIESLLRQQADAIAGLETNENAVVLVLL
ncbi:MAG: DUF5615 family PIN-like protein [Rhodocyclaceae bacterium]|nr:DUF5615 family PIN-like protein [Rhodocyclaceae bacterium]